MNNDAIATNTNPKKNEYAVTDRFAGYTFNNGA